MYNEIAMDADGVPGLRYERDAWGRATRISYLSYMGSSNSAKDSEHYEVIGIMTNYGYAGAVFSYDASGNRTGIIFLDSDGNEL